MKNLENYSVQELNAKEIRETDGGWMRGGPIDSVTISIYAWRYAFEGVKATLGFLSGIADGIKDGLED